jgi:hypothetical protein
VGIVRVEVVAVIEVKIVRIEGIVIEKVSVTIH